MGEFTKIEWCDSTLNLMMGCDGCELFNPKEPDEATCYAYHEVTRRAGLKGWPESFDKPGLFTTRIKEAERWNDLTGRTRPNKPWLNYLPRLIFLDDLGDTFTKSLPANWLAPLVPRMEKTPHVYQILTKQVRVMRDFFEALNYVPFNFWPMASITSQDTAFRLAELVQIDSPNLGLSIEPLLGPIKFDPQLLRKVNWAIIGAESGNRARRMDRGWAVNLIEQLGDAGLSVFVKQDADSKGRKISLPLLSGRQWTQMPEVK